MTVRVGIVGVGMAGTYHLECLRRVLARGAFRDGHLELKCPRCKARMVVSGIASTAGSGAVQSQMN